MSYNTLEINAALMSLVRQENIPASAQTVIEFALEYVHPRNSAYSLRGERNTTHTESFSAASDMGNIQYTDEKEEVQKFHIGDGKKRIGNFRMYRLENNIYFHEFWKSDETTSGTEEEESVMEYFIETHKDNTFKSFGIMKPETVFRINLGLFEFGLTRKIPVELPERVATTKEV